MAGAEATGVWGVVAVNLTLAGMIWGGFNATDRLLRPEVKKRIAAWVGGSGRGDSGDAEPSWPDTFIDVFDRLLVPAKRRGNDFPLPSLWRSAIASFITVALVGVLYATRSPEFREAIGEDLPIVGLVGLALMLNLLPDYLSLWGTRCVIHLMRDRGVVGRVCWLIADALITVAITYIALVFVLLLLVQEIDIDKTNSTYIEGLLLADRGVLGVFIYSTCLTSVWLWLYVLAGLVVRTLGATQRLGELLDRLFDLEQQPLSVMGWSLIVLLTAILWPTYAVLRWTTA